MIIVVVRLIYLATGKRGLPKLTSALRSPGYNSGNSRFGTGKVHGGGKA